MNLRRSTRYALSAVLEMATAPPHGLVTAAGVAAKHGLPPSTVAKIFQELARAGLATGARGTTGGYRLARPAAQITLLEVVELFEHPRDEEGHAGHPAAPPRGADARLREVFAEVEELSRATLASVSLATLVAPRRG